MAKLNKSEAVRKAQDMVRVNETVKAFTLKQIKQLDWDAKRKLSVEVLFADNAALYTRDFEVMDRYKTDFSGAYQDAVVGAGTGD